MTSSTLGVHLKTCGMQLTLDSTYVGLGLGLGPRVGVNMVRVRARVRVGGQVSRVGARVGSGLGLRAG